jgi:conjugative relaxase-like TrwC/TraI family protein
VVAVMSVHRMSAAGGFRYLLRHTASADVARGQESLVDYYTSSGNPAGRWLGTGLSALADGKGLAVGTLVSEAAITAVFGKAVDPVTGKALGRAFPTKTGADGVSRPAGVAGYDLTFTPVKSVSVLWALGDDRTRGTVEAAHRAAVTQTLAIVEARVAATRIGLSGATRVPVRGVVAAAFDHPDSRRGDPNLHTHVVVANRVQADDGVWRTLDGQQVFAAAVALSETYDALVADELARRMRVRFGWRDRGRRRTPAFEVDGIDDQLIALFSGRSRDITTHLQSLVAEFRTEHGRGPSRVETIRLRQTATLATRPVKTAHAWSDLLTSWAQRAREATGRTPRDLLAAALDGSYARPLRAVDVGPDSRRDLARLAVVGVEARRATWNGWNLEAEIARLTKSLSMASPTDRMKLHASVLVTAQAQCVALDTIDDLMARVREGLATTSPGDSSRVEDPGHGLARVGARSTATPQGDVCDREGSGQGLAPGTARPEATPGARAGEMEAALGRSSRSASPAMSRRYTSAAILNAEARLLAAATTGAGPSASPAFIRQFAAQLAAPGELDRSLRSRGLTPLSEDQAAAVVAVCTGGRAVQVLVGPAGTGKTTTLKAISELWSWDPWRETPVGGGVVGLAPSAAAAAELSQALGIRCETTAKWLHETTGPAGQKRTAELADLDARLQGLPTPGDDRWQLRSDRHQLRLEQDRWTLKHGQLLIVDEATLAGTLELDHLVTQAQQARAGVVLVGDHHQLSAVQAGGAFGLLARRTSTVELTGLWRFTYRWEAQSTRLLRHGDSTAIDRYSAHGRVHEGHRDAMITAAYAAWRADTDAGRDSLLVAADNDTVRELNLEARTGNILSGRATETGVELWDGTTAGVGDRITTRLNDRSLRVGRDDHVRNGDTWTITAVHHDGSLDATTTRSSHSHEIGEVRRLPADYVAEHVELGYAVTVHRAQSRTVDTAHVVTGVGMAREHLYVALTRGRDANHVYVPLDPGAAGGEAHQQLGLIDEPQTAREALTSILANPATELSATESLTGRRDPQPVTPIQSRPPEPFLGLDASSWDAPTGPVISR